MTFRYNKTKHYFAHKSLPGLYPKEEIASKSPASEKKVYDALKKAIPKQWYTWHSMKLRTEDNKFTEADFVIADPYRGILILEVKGGHIKKEAGLWYQGEHLLKMAPLDQAHRCRGILLDRFREKRIDPPTIGLAVCFPDMFVGDGPTQDDLRGLVIGEESLPYMVEILPDLMAKAIPKKRQTRGGWIKELHSMWCESWVPHPQLCLRAKVDMEKRVQLSLEQFEGLCRIIDNDRVLVKGGAGTGKTLLVMELAKMEAEEGRRVLVLCYTDALGFELARVLEGKENVEAAPIGKFALKLLRDKGQEFEESYTKGFWEPKTFEAAVDGMPDVEERWDTVIVDEGQDMGENDWCLIEECAVKRGRIWVFMDDTQAFLDRMGVSEEYEGRCVKYRLGKPYRCPDGIQVLADAYAGMCGSGGGGGGEGDEAGAGLSMVKAAVEDNVIKLVGCEEGKVHDAVGSEISSLLGEGFKGSEIAIISLRGMDLEENIVRRGKIGMHKVVLATDEMACERIVCDTFMRFKGLERPAVVVTDLRYVKDRLGMRMNIALTRALGVVRIVGEKTMLKQDPILSPFVRKG